MTAMALTTSTADPRLDVSPVEWEARVDLAACYRLAALNQWDDGIATHISARIPGEESFLINPFGLFFEEITASNLVKIDLDGNILSASEHSINRAGFVIHSAIHARRADAGCVIHLHTDDGVGVSCLADGLLPLNQTSMLIAEAVAYHDYEGVALDLDERERLGRDLDDRNLLILRNHGTLTIGETVAAAYTRMFILERSCTIQMRVLATGRPVYPAAPEAAARTAAIGAGIGGRDSDMVWAACRRKLDRLVPDYAT
jgi:ribulose-5-phosphate 4-epimerase/fuculose-1-phosphate aldolase